MVSKETTLKDVADRLDELIAWQRFESLPSLRTVLLKELDSETKKLAYEMTNGEKSRRDIATALGVSDDNVQHWWEKWYELAIVKPSKEFKGRPQHIVSLEEVGIKIPKKASAKKEEGKAVKGTQNAGPLTTTDQKSDEGRETEKVSSE